MKLEFLLKRFSYKAQYTIGILGYNDIPFLCNTLENPFLMIRYGNYDVIISYSDKFKRYLPLLQRVPDREGIRIHEGNTADDTKGCILPGINDKPGWVSNSRFYTNIIIDLITKYDTCSIKVY